MVRRCVRRSLRWGWMCRFEGFCVAELWNSALAGD